jgi:hypothetical protein
MTRTTLWTGIVLGALSFSISGCSSLASRADLERLEAKLQAQEQRSSAPASRFELHEVRNGTVVTTALLDNQTGRVWVVAGKQLDEFDPMPIVTFNPRLIGAGARRYAPPTAPTLETELPNGWTAEETAAATGHTPANPDRPGKGKP